MLNDCFFYLALSLASFSLRTMMRRLMNIMVIATSTSSAAPTYESFTPLYIVQPKKEAASRWNRHQILQECVP